MKLDKDTWMWLSLGLAGAAGYLLYAKSRDRKEAEQAIQDLAQQARLTEWGQVQATGGETMRERLLREHSEALRAAQSSLGARYS
jgi:hypothetical protein